MSRIRGNAKYKVAELRHVNKNQGVTSDQNIRYTSVRLSKHDLNIVRRIGYADREAGKYYMFITNHYDWSGKTITDIYKQR